MTLPLTCTITINYYFLQNRNCQFLKSLFISSYNSSLCIIFLTMQISRLCLYFILFNTFLFFFGRQNQNQGQSGEISVFILEGKLITSPMRILWIFYIIMRQGSMSWHRSYCKSLIWNNVGFWAQATQHCEIVKLAHPNNQPLNAILVLCLVQFCRVLQLN